MPASRPPRASPREKPPPKIVRFFLGNVMRVKRSLRDAVSVLDPIPGVETPGYPCLVAPRRIALFSTVNRAPFLLARAREETFRILWIEKGGHKTSLAHNEGRSADSRFSPFPEPRNHLTIPSRKRVILPLTNPADFCPSVPRILGISALPAPSPFTCSIPAFAGWALRPGAGCPREA